MAQDCVAEVDGIEEIYIRILSQIGQPIDRPHVASAQILTNPGATIKPIRSDVEAIIDGWLEEITTITEKVIRGELSTF